MNLGGEDTLDRRTFIKLLSSAGVSAAAYTACSAFMQDALAQSTAVEDLVGASAACGQGALTDIEHVILLMQENRSFDHYFGTLRGVRGFGDPRPLMLKSGTSVSEQANGTKPRIKPFHLKNGTTQAGQIFLEDVPHGHPDGLSASNNGWLDNWIPAKGVACMAHYTAADLPLYFKLAKAFTVCDAYFCSHNGATDPNRSYFFTGTAMGRDKNDYFSGSNRQNTNWISYPERLESAGIDWKFYQDGLTWTSDPFTGNYGDNTLEYFAQYRDKTTAIYRKNQSVNPVLRTSANTPSRFEQDILDDRLPSVSWIVPPEAFTEHPAFPPHFGEYYVNEILRALAANPAVWRKTALIITYDENGGFFDHVPPPVPPFNANQGLVSQSIVVEAPNNTSAFSVNSENSFNSLTKPTGMGGRVPLLMVSPWSVGGRVCSEVFDHTSPIRFLEAWLSAKGRLSQAAPYSRISSWRKAIAGDLTSVLDFKCVSPSDLKQLASPPDNAVILTSAEKDAARQRNEAPFNPNETHAAQDASIVVATKQDAAQCDLLPVGYDFRVFCKFEGATATDRFRFNFSNAGTLGVAFSVYAYHRSDGPWPYSLARAANPSSPQMLSDTWMPAKGNYRYVVHGPNGHMVEFSGNDTILGQRLLPEVVAIKLAPEPDRAQFVFQTWPSANGSALTMINAYTEERVRVSSGTIIVDVTAVDGWYDIAFIDANTPTSTYLRRFAGHLESGIMSRTDPAIGKIYDTATRVYKKPPVA